MLSAFNLKERDRHQLNEALTSLRVGPETGVTGY